MRKKGLLLTVILILALPLQSLADDWIRGDIDGDGAVTISDVTCLIDYLLTGQWGDESERMTITVGDVSFVMLRVTGGSFTMGAVDDDEAYEWEMPAHDVTLSDFWMGETEVTQALWQAVMGDNPSHFTGNLNCPVENVSWTSCHEFIDKLNEFSGMTFCLPTSAQWEFAARGGNKGRGYAYAGSDDVNKVAWFDENSGNTTHPVGQKDANELGLYDMSGNVHEWCQDWFEEYSDMPQTDPTGPEDGTYRILRGGCWSSTARRCRVSYFNFNQPWTTSPTLGLRLSLKTE